jgi:hypothetical protein
MEKLILIKNFPNRSFAEQAKEVLSANGIGCLLQSIDPGIFGSGSVSTLRGVDLYVNKDDHEKALGLIDALYDGI